jgi:parvulin-like peptidyl-prolyl isomerase
MDSKRFNLWHLSVLFLGVALVIFFVLLSSVVYSVSPTAPVVRTATKIIPYPAAVVNWQPILISTVMEQYDGMMKYYSGSAQSFGMTAPTEEQALEQVVDTLIRKAIVYQLAEEYGAELNEEEVNQLMNDAVTDAGTSEDLVNMLESSFGWSMEEFRLYVIEPLAVSGALEGVLLEDDEYQADRRAAADAALVRIQAGEDFAVVAGEVSDDESSVDGGYIGLFAQDELPEEWGEAIFALDEGGISVVVETRYAYGIFLVNKFEEVEGVLQADINVIGVKKNSIEELVESATEEAKIWNLIEN